MSRQNALNLYICAWSTFNSHSSVFHISSSSTTHFYNEKICVASLGDLNQYFIQSRIISNIYHSAQTFVMTKCLRHTYSHYLQVNVIFQRFIAFIQLKERLIRDILKMRNNVTKHLHLKLQKLIKKENFIKSKL